MKRNVFLLRTCLVVALSVFAGGCISAPRQTIELADVVAEQSSALEASHRAVVRAYFEELERRVDDFIDKEWTPAFLSRAVGSEQVQSGLGKVRAGLGIDLDELRNAARERFSEVEAEIIVKALVNVQIDYRAEFGSVMIDFAAAAVAEINRVRRELKEPLNEKESEFLGLLDEGYSNLHQGQAALRAYLASVVELVEQQDALLEKLSLIDERDIAMNAVIKASEESAKAADRIDKITKKLSAGTEDK